MMSFQSVTPKSMENYVSDWKMSPGLWSADFLFLTGMTGAGPDGTVSNDPEMQIRLAFQRGAAVLQEAGIDFSSVVEMTSYHVGIQDHIDVFRRVRAEFVREPFPAWTAIEVNGFVTPGTICELRIVAARKGKQ